MFAIRLSFIRLTFIRLLCISLLGSVLRLPAIAQQLPLANGAVRDADYLDARTQLEQTVRYYRHEIQQRHGVYDQQAIELYTSLGDALMQLGAFQEASAMYNEALQGARINDGLYAESQLAILDSYTVSALAEKDWPQVDRNFYLALDVAGQTIAPDSPEFESLIRRFTNWKIEVHRNSLDVENHPRSIDDTIESYEVLIDSLREDGAGYKDKLVTYRTEKRLVEPVAA